jgi:hypothetical protein
MVNHSSSGTNEPPPAGPDDCAEHMLLQARAKGFEQWTNIYAAQLAHFATYCEVRAIAQPVDVAQRPADSGEPVAWQYKHESNGDDGWCMLKAGDDPTEFLKQWPSIKYDVRPLYASPPAPLQAGTWMPIETAPKNRLLLVGFFNAVGKWRSMHAQYRDDLPQHDDADDGDEPAEAGWYEGSLEAEMLFPVRPTHWQPLPAGPSVPSTEGK